MSIFKKPLSFVALIGAAVFLFGTTAFALTNTIETVHFYTWGEGDGIGPYSLTCTASKEGSHVHVLYTGSSPSDAGSTAQIDISPCDIKNGMVNYQVYAISWFYPRVICSDTFPAPHNIKLETDNGDPHHPFPNCVFNLD